MKRLSSILLSIMVYISTAALASPFPKHLNMSAKVPSTQETPLQGLPQPIEITDSHGKIRFTEIPKRIVVLNWAMLESILELGLEPVGVADLKLYRGTVGIHHIPETVIDLGPRSAPNLKTIQTLKPDVILLGYSQRPLIRQLSHLGQVIYFNHFSHRENNDKRGQAFYLTLAKVFGKTPLAQKQLTQRDTFLQELNRNIEQHFLQQPPKVVAFLPQSPNKAWIFLHNSMIGHAITHLGLDLPIQSAPSKLGVTLQPIRKLQEKSTCYFIVGSESDNKLKDHLEGNKWREFMANQNCIHYLWPAPLYGSVFSIAYLAKSITDLLLLKQLSLTPIADPTIQSNMAQ